MFETTAPARGGHYLHVGDDEVHENHQSCKNNPIVSRIIIHHSVGWLDGFSKRFKMVRYNCYPIVYAVYAATVYKRTIFPASTNHIFKNMRKRQKT